MSASKSGAPEQVLYFESSRVISSERLDTAKVIRNVRLIRADCPAKALHGALLARSPIGRTVMSFGLYLIGFIVLVVGLAIGANMLHIPQQWIGVGIVVMVGLGILSGVTMTRRRDPSD